MSCEHEEFSATVDVAKVRDEEGGPIREYHASITIVCSECGQPFEFLGLPGGLVFDAPTHGWTRDGRPEARLPIRPSFATARN